MRGGGAQPFRNGRVHQWDKTRCRAELAQPASARHASRPHLVTLTAHFTKRLSHQSLGTVIAGRPNPRNRGIVYPTCCPWTPTHGQLVPSQSSPPHRLAAAQLAAFVPCSILEALPAAPHDDMPGPAGPSAGTSAPTAAGAPAPTSANGNGGSSDAECVMVDAPPAVEALGGGGSSASLEAVPAGDSDALLLLSTDHAALRRAATAYLDSLVSKVGWRCTRLRAGSAPVCGLVLHLFVGWRCTCLRAGAAPVCGLALHLFVVLFGPAYMGSRHEADDSCLGCLGCLGCWLRCGATTGYILGCSCDLQRDKRGSLHARACPPPRRRKTGYCNLCFACACLQLDGSVGRPFAALLCTAHNGCLLFSVPSQFDESVDRMFAALRAGEGGAPRSSAGGSTPAGAATPGAPPAAGAAPALDTAALAAAVSAAGAGGAQSALAAAVAAAGGPQAAVAALQAAAGTAAAAGAAAEEAGEAGEEDEDMEGSALLMSEDEGVLLGPSDAEVAAAGAAGAAGGGGSGAVKGSPEYQSGGPPGC